MGSSFDDIEYNQAWTGYGGFSESDLVEKPTIELFASLGWQTANLFGEFGKGGAAQSSEGRESKRQAFLPNRLWQALRLLNPAIDEAALGEACSILARDRGAIDPVRANAEFYVLLLNGIRIKVRSADGALIDETVRVVDWEKPEANDFLLASQVWFAGDLYTRRADLVGFVNGLPLLLIELKAAYKALSDAHEGNLRDYIEAIPHVFVPNAFVILSNGIDAKLGSALAPLEHFNDWKRIDDEQEPGIVSLDTLVRGTCPPARFLDIVENFIAFEAGKHGTIKKVVKTHQFLGVNRALMAVDKIKENQGKLGVYWHTQGSGKSLSMFFFARKVLRKKPGDWTFLIVTDRAELDDQIADTFSNCGVLGKPRQAVQASSRKHLQELLRGNERFIFTLIQKFGTARGERYPLLSERSDIIVITDEAHRSQYDVLAANMREALPNAAFIGFTGTPLMAGEERTREVFGDYVSIYDFAQSVADGATVPLYYESRLPELHITDEALGEEIKEVLDKAELSEEEEDALARRFAKPYQLITNDDRLDKIAADVVRHFSGRGYRGKAMFIAIDKATAIKMYDKVKHFWNEMLDRESARLSAVADAVKQDAFAKQLEWLRQTDMAVVVSNSQNEVEFMAKRGLDIKSHRARLVNEDLGEKFKTADDPLRLVFVCAMWITGFDVPTCSTIYLDKPMKNHTLMQTIARANRTAPGKQAGLIADYVGVFRNLKKALAIYAAPRPGVTADPIEEKRLLLEGLREALAKALSFAGERGVYPDVILKATGFERQAKLADAAEAMLGVDADKRAFLHLVGNAWTLFRAVLPDPRANEFRGDVIVFQVVAERIRSLLRAKPSNKLLEAIAEIERLIDEAVSGCAIRTPVPSGEDMRQLFDLSTIDFEKLAAMFKQGRKRTAAEILRAQAEERASKLAADNPSRVDLLDWLQRLIDEYNTGSLDVERLFDELKNFVRSLDEEEARHLKENLTPEELSVFDILTRPEPKLTQNQEVQVKKIARDMLARLKKDKLILDWRLKATAKSAVREAIREDFDALPEVYDRQLWDEKVERAYQFIFERYPGPTSINN